MLSPIADVKRRAKQLSFGFEAAETLGVGSYAESEGAKLARGAYDMDFSRARREEKTYARGTTIKLEAPPSTLERTRVFGFRPARGRSPSRAC